MEYQIGSKLLKLANNKDDDKVVIISDSQTLNENDRKKDHFYFTTEELNLRFQYKGTPIQNLTNYQFDKDIIQQDFPIEFHILDHVPEVLKMLNDIIDNRLFNVNEKIRYNYKFCTKIVYHVVYNAFILLNKSTTLTWAQFDDIQKIHDGQMPIEYIETLKQIIKSLNVMYN